MIACAVGPAEPIAQRLAPHVRHGVPEKSGGLPRVEHWQYVGVIEPRRGADLAQEALGAEQRRELRMEHLEGNESVVSKVPREPDRGHAPAPELPLEHVTVPQGLSQNGGRVGHRTGLCEGGRNVRSACPSGQRWR